MWSRLYSCFIDTHVNLQILFISAAVPMIGFGFMDNLVMITMGEFIDSTMGVTFGLSTLTAAGFGQIFSGIRRSLSMSRRSLWGLLDLF